MGRSPAREVVVLHLLREIGRYSLKILGLGCLALILAGPTMAQEQTPKEKAVPPAAQEKPAEIPTMAPSPGMDDYKAKEAPSPMRQEETLQKKKVTGKVGGQEIRAKEGEENK